MREYGIALMLLPKNRTIREEQLKFLRRFQMLSYGEIGPVGTLDPITGRSPAERRIGQFLYSSMVTLRFDPSVAAGHRYFGDLARKWTLSLETGTHVFHLNDRIMFSDGSPIQAADVEFSLRTRMDPGTYRSVRTLREYVSGVTASGAREVRVRFSRSFARPLPRGPSGLFRWPA